VYAIATFVIVAILSMIFTRLATGALIATGLPPEIASFQARSAFTGAGFTTTEAESVVNHPQRRKVLSTTMLVGNLGTPTLIVTVLLGFLAPGPGDTEQRLLAGVGALIVILLILNSRPVSRWINARGQAYAQKRLVPAVGEFRELLTLDAEYVVGELHLTADRERLPRTVRALDEALPQTRVLGVRSSDGTRPFTSSATEDLELHTGDALVVFGTRPRLRQLAEHGSGDGPGASPS
jgi:hypothetical protein